MKILYFDVAAIVLQSILLLSLFSRKMVKGRDNTLFVLLLVQVILTTILDFWSELYPTWIPVDESNTALRWIMCFLYYLFRNFNPVLYQMFFFAVTDTWDILRKSRILQTLLITPYGISVIILFSNIFNNSVYYFDENLFFHFLLNRPQP